MEGFAGMAKIVCTLEFPISTEARVAALAAIMNQVQARLENFAVEIEEMSPTSLIEVKVEFRP